ncbi:P-loop containing nucleoside triphosphate hydrolase protein [Gilbertella persicaria]|uniref:P-loop containing nucleoside triphosphate hydrolase protein n=1 Tax=Gilbertella persicaria TaxID=101096 RepID=UPI00221E510F|nr:P-loop containing nucleoside triphosphate hydrolase protein [Gilbertella persicaria]KAI8080739.1 P-loop containing nucleoside triphosphate hydrolase protein [Gilbertella persicaria]
MSSTQYGMLPQTKESLDHILRHYEAFKQDIHAKGLPIQPMLVGVSGCQGSGKTTLCDTLTHLLKETYHLNAINFSLDDFYLTHQEQLKLSQTYPDNPLYQQRGQAGSHDLELLCKTLYNVIHTNDKVAIPVYDKSMFGGAGDRSSYKYPQGPFDIVLFEGWMLGFKSLPEHVLSNFKVNLDHVRVMNKALRSYEQQVYPFLDIFIHLSPQHISQVYEWRLQQEQHMKTTRGVDGLSDDAVRLFVDTYMPAYEMYLPRLNQVGFYGKGLYGEPIEPYEGMFRQDKGYSQPGRHLKVILDQGRRVVESITLREPIVQPKRTLLNQIMSKKSVYRMGLIGLIGFIGYRSRRSIFHLFLKFFE